jgi:hypothetical protein
VLATLRQTGDVGSLSNRLITWEERQGLVGLQRIDELERMYLELPAAPSPA